MTRPLRTPEDQSARAVNRLYELLTIMRCIASRCFRFARSRLGRFVGSTRWRDWATIGYFFLKLLGLLLYDPEASLDCVVRRAFTVVVGDAFVVQLKEPLAKKLKGHCKGWWEGFMQR